MSKEGLADAKSPSELIDERIAALGDWRGAMLAVAGVDPQGGPRGG